MIASAVYNAQRAKHSDYFFNWQDLFPGRKRAEPQTDEQMMMVMDMWARRQPENN